MDYISYSLAIFGSCAWQPFELFVKHSVFRCSVIHVACMLAAQPELDLGAGFSTLYSIISGTEM